MRDKPKECLRRRLGKMQTALTRGKMHTVDFLTELHYHCNYSGLTKNRFATALFKLTIVNEGDWL